MVSQLVTGQVKKDDYCQDRTQPPPVCGKEQGLGQQDDLR